MKNAYCLTNGTEILECRMMSEDEAREANEVADRVTDGKLWWGKVSARFLDEPDPIMIERARQVWQDLVLAGRQS